MSHTANTPVSPSATRAVPAAGLMLDITRAQGAVPAGRALRLRATRTGSLCSQERLWATLDSTPRLEPGGLGDHLIAPGQPLRLLSGQSVLVEPLDQRSWANWFWEPDSAPVRTPAELSQPVLLAPSRDLLRGLALVLRASRDLALALPVALWRAGSLLVAGRGRVLGRLESNQP